MTHQKNLFPAGDDLPLFSGTPQPGKDPSFTPKDDPQQLTMYNCSICKDTGKVMHPKRYNMFIRCDYCAQEDK